MCTPSIINCFVGREQIRGARAKENRYDPTALKRVGHAIQGRVAWVPCTVNRFFPSEGGHHLPVPEDCFT